MPDLTHHLNDLVTAFPAAFARVLLGNRQDPLLRFIVGVQQKASVLVGSLFFAVMAGQAARSFEPTSKWATLIVIASAFNAQDLCSAIIRQSKKEIRKRFYNRNENSDS
jgi:hypothetical protein